MKLTPDHETAPPPELRGRVMGSMAAAGLLRGGRRPPFALRHAIPGLLLVAAFATGLLLGRWEPTGSPVSEGGTRFLLMLYEDESFNPQGSEAELMAEYAAWAGQSVESGVVLGGARLSADSYVVPRPPTGQTLAEPAGGMATGYFVISAASREAAVALAGSNPHVEYGGTVVVRPIEE